DGGRRPGAEDAIHPPGVEPESAQPPLQDHDVVASEHGLTVVQHPVAQLETGLHQAVPRLGAADAVDAKAASSLEGPDRLVGGGAVVPGCIPVGLMTEEAEPGLDV